MQTGPAEIRDADLVAALAGGDRAALAELYGRHAPWLLLRLSRRCGDPGMVDEVVQDTFVAVWRGASRWDGRGEVAAWIWGIGVRRLLDALRRRPAATAFWAKWQDNDSRVEQSAEERVLPVWSTATSARLSTASRPSFERSSKRPSWTA